MSASTLDLALYYAGRGWRVFPLVHSTKRPATEHGYLDATTDEGTIRSWWQRWPDAGVAIATGSASGLVVLDVDPRHGGDESLIELETRHGWLPDTPVSLTGGGGSHSYFAHPGGSVPCRTGLPGFPGLDLKGDGGYCAAPPSLHPNGERYQWNPWMRPAAVPLAPCPEVLIRLASTARDSSRKSYSTAHWSGKTPARALALIRADRNVRERFRRSSDRLNDSSPSGVDFALALRLAARRLSGAEIEATLRASRAKAGLPERPPTYYQATVGKALGAAAHAA